MDASSRSYSGAGLARLPDDARKHLDTSSLDLSSNKFKEIPPLGQFEHLSSVDLSRNEISVFDLSRLPRSVRVVKMDENVLTEIVIDQSIYDYSIETLSLNDNEIVSIECADAKSAQPTSIKNLSLSGNVFNELDPCFLTLFSNLERLVLSDNSLCFLPTEISLLKKLLILDVSNNSIEYLPNEIEELRSLRVLNASNNKLVSVPNPLFNLAELEHLDLSKNQIQDIPPSIGRLSKLKTLILSSNYIKSVPKTIEKLESLVLLRLDENEITEIPNFDSLPSIKEINLNMNRLTEIPEDFGDVGGSLERLYLSRNRISRIPDSFSKLKKLQKLYLGWNRLSEFPVSVFELDNLEELSLTSNEIRRIPDLIINKLPNLRELFIEENPIENVRPDVLGQGLRSIRFYLRAISTSKSESIVWIVAQEPDEVVRGREEFARRRPDLSAKTQEFPQHRHKHRSRSFNLARNLSTLEVDEKESLRRVLEYEREKKTLVLEIQTLKERRQRVVELLEKEKERYKELKGETEKMEKELDGMRKEFETIKSQRRDMEQEILSVSDSLRLIQDSHNEIDGSEIRDIAVIGRGSYGTVTRSVWRGMTVAVKRIKPEFINEKYLKEFKREVLIMSKARHPNICLFMGASTKESDCFLVTEYCENGDLHSYLQKNKIESESEYIRIAKEIALGMNYLHLNKPEPILHRDLKSFNILLTRHGTVKLADFGMSRNKKMDKTLTSFRGTPCWMAPEIILDKKYNEKVDVYSYGIVLWELKTGEIPYSEFEDGVKVAVAVGYRDVRPPLDAVEGERWRKLMKRCWHKNPEKRPTFSKIIRTLRKWAKEDFEQRK